MSQAQVQNEFSQKNKFFPCIYSICSEKVDNHMYSVQHQSFISQYFKVWS